ncbi:hypothetical protein ACVME8_004187 [Bradyrhizobium diazoefficiens]
MPMTRPSGNHESLESKIPKRKKPRPNTRLSCKIEYFIETTSAYLSGRSAFFTDDSLNRAYISPVMNGLVIRSWPMLEPAPWPQMKPTSSPSGNSLVLIELISVA